MTQIKAGKFQLVKLGIEEIPEYIRSLQEQTGQDVETISFEQTELMDVVRAIEITFWRRGEKGRGDAMVELARKVDVLAEAIKTAVAHFPATPRPFE